MHDVLKKLFDKVIFYEADCIKVGRKLDEEVNIIIEPLRESMLENLHYIFCHLWQCRQMNHMSYKGFSRIDREFVG